MARLARPLLLAAILSTLTALLLHGPTVGDLVRAVDALPLSWLALPVGVLAFALAVVRQLDADEMSIDLVDVVRAVGVLHSPTTDDVAEWLSWDSDPTGEALATAECRGLVRSQSLPGRYGITWAITPAGAREAAR